MSVSMVVIICLFSLVLGFFFSFLFWQGKKSRFFREKEQELDALRCQNLSLEKSLTASEVQKENIAQQLVEQKTQFERVKSDLEKQRLAANDLENQNSFLKERMENQIKEFDEARKKSIVEFENISNQLMRKNNKDFNDLNSKNMLELLSPLKEKIQLFEKKIEETYEKSIKDQTDIRAELKKLQDLNLKISDDANNLTKALKGDVKQQGNWGEFVLEKILERSGLTEGREFEREVASENAEGKNIRPDVIINLPDKKHLIIDSKLSLVAYERFVNAESDAEQKEAIKEHLNSVRSHVKELSQKHYSSSPNFNSPDFVLMFIPIESSFRVAIEHDQQLFNYAWDNKIVIVSPTTLLATLRTIASVWQQENQTRNAIEIAKQGGALYDKFAGFIEDMDKIGKQIDLLGRAYSDAEKKLYTGRGNLVSKAEQLKNLGASVSKQIPDKFKED